MASASNNAFNAIADPTRREILRMLRKKEMTAGELAERLAGLPAGLCISLLVAAAAIPALYSLVYSKRLERSADLES